MDKNTLIDIAARAMIQWAAYGFAAGFVVGAFLMWVIL